MTDCIDIEAHIAHMEVNGECPWCAAVDQSAVVEMTEAEIIAKY